MFFGVLFSFYSPLVQQPEGGMKQVLGDMFRFFVV